MAVSEESTSSSSGPSTHFAKEARNAHAIRHGSGRGCANRSRVAHGRRCRRAGASTSRDLLTSDTSDDGDHRRPRPRPRGHLDTPTPRPQSGDAAPAPAPASASRSFGSRTVKKDSISIEEISRASSPEPLRVRGAGARRERLPSPLPPGTYSQFSPEVSLGPISIPLEVLGELSGFHVTRCDVGRGRRSRSRRRAAQAAQRREQPVSVARFGNQLRSNFSSYRRALAKYGRRYFCCGHSEDELVLYDS